MKLQKNSWFAIGLLLVGTLLAIRTVVGMAFNPDEFMSFSLPVIILIVSIAIYMIVEILMISKEIKKKI